MSQLAACLDISPNDSYHWGIRLLTNNNIMFCCILLYFNNINMNFRH